MSTRNLSILQSLYDLTEKNSIPQNKLIAIIKSNKTLINDKATQLKQIIAMFENQRKLAKIIESNNLDKSKKNPFYINTVDI